MRKRKLGAGRGRQFQRSILHRKLISARARVVANPQQSGALRDMRNSPIGQRWDKPGHDASQTCVGLKPSRSRPRSPHILTVEAR